jgi:BirA family transcriptional regulator, biotin operon repressor / biotin---[acetyl-CoA-carboxylase] ligase
MAHSLTTLFIGQTIVRLDEVDSTNTFLLKQIQEGFVPEGMTVIARAQTQGRGQRGNVWETEAGANLILSLLLRPTFLEVNQQFDLTRMAALAIHQTISEILPREAVKIKWPNDLVVDGKKIAGMLIENSISGKTISTAVVGLGVNINQTQFSEQLTQATSLARISGTKYDVEELMIRFLTNFEKYYLLRRQGKSAELDAAYHQVLFRRDFSAHYSDATGEFKAILMGVSSEGKLILKDDSEKIRIYNFKEIVFR